MTTPNEASRSLDDLYGLGVYGDQNAGKEKPDPVRLKVHNLQDVVPSPVTWLWPGRLPVGKFCILAGDPGLGKSYLTLDVAARVSQGGKWPDGGDVPLGRVIIISAEDGLADTIRPRLDLLGADLAKIEAISPTVESESENRSFNLQDHLKLLEDKIVTSKTNLLILDPILAFTGNKDTHKSSDVRAVMAPLSSMADATQCTILAIIHLNKKTGEFNSIYRLTGSLDFAAAARSVLVVGKHPEIEGHRILAPVKMNLSAMPESLQYCFTDDGKFEWGGVSQLEANDILSAPIKNNHTARAVAENFLREILADGPMAAKELYSEAAERGHSESTLKRAGQEVGVYKYQVGETGKSGSGGHVWSLNPNPRNGNNGVGSDDQPLESVVV
jgi:archaellum biogenesis ATPase FlaH